MDFINLLFIFFFGACVGSFLGVVVDRVPQGKSIVKGRSQCDHCHRKLGFFDLIPVFSFIFLGGRCRYCHRRLSIFYPVVELLTGVLFVIVFLTQGIMNPESGIMNYVLENIYYLFIVSILVAIFFIDLKYGLIPFPFVIFATVVTFFYLILNTKYLLLNNILAAVGSLLFFLTLFLVTRGKGMGFGDVVYAFFMGLLLGIPKIVLGLYIAFISGALISLILIAMKIKKLKGSTIPFGPFLVAGTIISLFWGDRIISLTFNFLQFTIK